MASALRPGFLINDPEHAPFGMPWLKGITLARLGLVAAICAAAACQPVANLVAMPDKSLLQISSAWMEWEFLFLFGALPMFLGVVVAERATQKMGVGRRIVILAGVVVAGAAVFGSIIWAYSVLRGAPARSNALIGYAMFFRALTYGGLFTGVLFFVTRHRLAERGLHRSRMERLGNERQIAEAHLQLLHAQIEPHFLFNSLASVKRLYETEPEKGRALLRNMGEYLGVAMPSWRQQETRLDAELALSEAYLSIFRTRMGERLRSRIDVMPGLGSTAIPPLMLGTLIENALKHGIGPRASGGSISISAREQSGVMHVSVADDGIGFQGESGHGVGLANVRARLQSLYGDAASLDLARNSDGGVTATLQWPCRALAGVMS